VPVEHLVSQTVCILAAEHLVSQTNNLHVIPAEHPVSQTVFIFAAEHLVSQTSELHIMPVEHPVSQTVCIFCRASCIADKQSACNASGALQTINLRVLRPAGCSVSTLAEGCRLRAVGSRLGIELQVMCFRLLVLVCRPPAMGCRLWPVGSRLER
jgi:hypothetical protein